MRASRLFSFGRWTVHRELGYTARAAEAAAIDHRAQLCGTAALLFLERAREIEREKKKEKVVDRVPPLYVVVNQRE